MEYLDHSNGERVPGSRYDVFEYLDQIIVVQGYLDHMTMVGVPDLHYSGGEYLGHLSCVREYLDHIMSTWTSL